MRYSGFLKKSKKQDQVNRQGAGKQQRVYTYYTASKRQIDDFEKSRPKNSRGVENNKQRFIGFGQKSAAILIAIIVMVFAILLLFITSDANIKIVGQQNYNSAEYYKNLINSTINNDFNNRFKPVLNEEDLENLLEEKIPEATIIEVNTSLLSRGVNVKITTSNPIAVFLQQDAPSYVLDSTGKLVVDIINTSLDTSKLSTMTNDSGLSYELGDQIFKPAEAVAVSNLHFQYTKGDANKRISYTLPAEPRELQVKHSGYYARYSTDEDSGADIVQQYGALRATQNRIQDQRGSAPKEYIDVRLGDKVFVK